MVNNELAPTLGKKQNFFSKWWNYFTTYEKCWFFIFTALTILASIFFPEDSLNGIDGWILTVIYLVNVVLGIFCELLASKQSKWSFFIYIFVEIIEIVKFILISAMFSSMIVCLFFWLPMHIISFVHWHKHEDRQNKEVTIVRSLKPKHAILMFIGVAIWTVGMGYIFAAFGPDSELYSSEATKVAVCYLDACYSALSIANGILLYFRFKENWIVWLVASFVCMASMSLTGLWVFVILQVGYITNTFYGYGIWTKYIKNKKKEENVDPQTVACLASNVSIEEQNINGNDNVKETLQETNKSKETITIEKHKRTVIIEKDEQKTINNKTQQQKKNKNSNIKNDKNKQITVKRHIKTKKSL